MTEGVGKNEYFNPLPPCGGRHKEYQRRVQMVRISIHSLRVEGDQDRRRHRKSRMISIHSLRVEGDR